MLARTRGSKARKINFNLSKPSVSPEPISLLSRRPLSHKYELPAELGGLPPRIARYLQTAALPSPCLIIDTDLVEHNYLDLHQALPEAEIFYAVKANPADEILVRLAKLGSKFDIASIGEIEICLRHGIAPERLSYGNTIKKERDIKAAFDHGVRLFAFDSTEELDKLARAAPGARVFCRILVDCEGAEWPLSRKFGCEIPMAVDLLVKAKQRGLDAYGISFHVGSQQTDCQQFDKAIGQARALFDDLRTRGINLRMINVGGGFPSRYNSDIPSIEAYAGTIRNALEKCFANEKLDLIVEPGRYIVGDAGVIQAEVVLVSQKSESDQRRWVYLDVGKFHGLIETMDEAIKYRVLTPHDGGPVVPAILAGPTCDSADILYEKSSFTVPAALKAGDRVIILATGAYTTTYSSVAFNGMPPLASVCI